MEVAEKFQVARALSERIRRELREINLVTSESDELTKANDIDFTIMITDQTMNEGIVRLRHRSPKVTEEVHVTNLGERLTQLTR